MSNLEFNARNGLSVGTSKIVVADSTGNITSTGNIQIGQNATSTNNFTFSSTNSGSLLLTRGNIGSPLDNIFTISSTGNVTITGNLSSSGNIAANLIGDVTSISNITTLATVNSNIGMFGDAGVSPQFTVNGKGLITSIANIGIPNAVTLSGNVTSTGGSTSSNAIVTVTSVGGSTAANINLAEVLANSATNLNTASTIVKRDASGNFITGNISGNFITGNIAATKLIVPTSSGVGVQVGTPTVSSYPWNDIVGVLIPGPAVAQPALSAFRGGAVDAYNFAVNDEINLSFHMLHDYLVGSDVFLHIHWGHNGTAISGNLVVTFGVTVAKGHNQAAFGAEVAPVLTISTPDVATIPQWRHIISEFQLSAASPSATQINTNTLEPDSLILVNLTVTTIPTITGGATARPFIFAVDLHYQTTNIGTLNKAPAFYG